MRYKMEKLPMCRICLAENVRMHKVVNRNLHELYEKLNDVPFVTEDRRPILVCFFCCAKLKRCYQLLRQCQEAEELFAQMMNEDYETNSFINQDHLEVFSGFNTSPIEHISIVDECETESIAIKEELPAACEALDGIIEPKQEHQSDELKAENLDNSCLDVADTPPHYSESDLEDDVFLMEFKTAVKEEQAGSKKKRRAREVKRTTVAKKPKLDTRRTKPEDVTAERTKKDNSKVIRTSQNCTSKSDTYFKKSFKSIQSNLNRVNKIEIIHQTHTQIGEKPYKCYVCQGSFSQKCDLKRHFRIHTGEKPYKCYVCQRSFSDKGNLTRHIRMHTGVKPYKCDMCQRSFSQKVDLTRHIRIHTGEKPYKCDVCHSSFCKNSDLTKHILTHSGENPYKCSVCQRSFGYKGNLTKHIRIHTSEKPYT